MVDTATIGSGTCRAYEPSATPDATSLASDIVQRNSGPQGHDVAAIGRELAAVKAYDETLGAQLASAIEAQLTPVERGQLASGAFSIAAPDGSTLAFSPTGMSVADQFASTPGSPAQTQYARLDRIWGDGNPATNDSAAIESGLRDMIASGRTIDQLESGNYAPVQAGTQTEAPANDDAPDTATLVADLIQMGGDIVGIFDQTGITDAANGVFSLGRAGVSLWNGDGWGALGHVGNGVLSGVSAVPLVGDAAKLGKFGKWAQTVSDSVSAVAHNPALRATFEPAMRQVADAVNAVPQSVVDALPASARESFDRMKSQLDEFFGAGARAADARPRVELEGGSKGNWSPELNARTLQPDTDYVVNGYTYRTDASGQVSQVEGRLELQTADRNTYQQGVAGRTDRLEGDQGGHLIASIFNGAGERVNLVPMDGNLNMGRWKSLETTLADALREGRTVDVKIDVRYPEGSARPNGFRIEYSIDGNTQVQTFRNTPGGN